jgi:hypothetical protein
MSRTNNAYPVPHHVVNDRLLLILLVIGMAALIISLFFVHADRGVKFPISEERAYANVHHFASDDGHILSVDFVEIKQIFPHSYDDIYVYVFDVWFQEMESVGTAIQYYVCADSGMTVVSWYSSLLLPMWGPQ